MRLDKVYIDGFKNLHDVSIDFDERRLATVIIGQNGSGKSNLIESIVAVFRSVDLNRDKPLFKYEIDYRIGKKAIRLSNRHGQPTITVDGAEISRKEFDQRRSDLFPDLVFGYYSGSSRRLEALFDTHQKQYYDAIKQNNDDDKCREALEKRRLFYCRPIHGVFALLSFFAFIDGEVAKLLRDKLGVTGFHSLLAHFREPWFAKGGRSKKVLTASDLWGAKGPAGKSARRIRDHAFHPIALEGNAIDDYRDKQQIEAQFAAFLKDGLSLKTLAANYKDDREMFYALESMDISDLIREFHLWVTRINDTSGDVSFSDLSDGERQLLMVLGLIRIARGKRALFLLDEPDTHLNPHWQHAYLDLISKWTGMAADAENCHIVLTSHNPLTISALNKDEVRVMYSDAAGKVIVQQPYADPRGLGFTAILTEVFGLPSSLDFETQKMIDDRNTLAHMGQRSDDQEKSLIEINDKLNKLGFLFEDREPLYQDFLRAWHDVRYAGRPMLSPEQIELRHKALQKMIKELMKSREVSK